MIDKKDILVLDIECWSDYDISKENEDYLKDATIKWISFYSYRTEKVYVMPRRGNEALIAKFIAEHSTIVTFNGDAFDIPILKNNKNDMWPEKYRKSIDVKDVLVGRAGRGYLMGYEFKGNSLKEIAATMQVETMKGDIDHEIWKKDEWTEEELVEIKKYCEADALATKQIFDKIWDFWLPFTNFITQKNVYNYSWITSSEGSLAYKYYCNIMGLPEEYGEKGGKTEGGGRVIEPRVEEETDVIYVDVRSLYPHMYALFNLFAEVPEGAPGAWHGNDVFKVRGYYDIHEPHKACVDMMEKLRARIEMKKKDPKNPLAYTYKIILNSIYGANRSTVFTNLYTANSGYDCCWLGRQVNRIMEAKMAELGYTTISGDTDSIFVKHKDGVPPFEKIQADLKSVTDYILSHVPFPQPDTFEIEVEAIIPYIMFVQEEGKTLKKNYCYIKKKVGKPNEVVVMGLPIKKVNHTELGWNVFKNHIEPRMIEENRGKFETNWILEKVDEELGRGIHFMAQEYKAKPYDSYSFSGKKCLHAQISKAYLDGRGGKVKLIKNTRAGKVGSKFKYCTIEEAKEHNLRISDLDMTKTYNELYPFCKGHLDPKKKPQAQGFFNTNIDEDAPSRKSTLPVIEKTRGGFFE